MDDQRQDGTRRSEGFDDRLSEALKEGWPRASFPRREIEERLEHTLGRRAGTSVPQRAGRAWWRGSTARSVLAAAASLLLFIGGMEYGRRTAVPERPIMSTADELTPIPAAPASLPLTIQSAGSEYVASLARFNGEAAGLSTEQRRVAREVALTVLYGAALELLRSSAEDEALEGAVRLLSVTALESGSEGGP